MTHKINNELTDADFLQLDQIIMKYWDAQSPKNKKKVELECYKELKTLNFNPVLISYLRDNDADALADEMEHFRDLYQKVPHDHEKRMAA